LVISEQNSGDSVNMDNKVIMAIETSNWSIEHNENMQLCDIVRIALLDVEDSNKTWSINLLPILCNSYNNDVNFLPANEAIQKFVHHLEENYPQGCILVAHNGYQFDFPHLKRYIEKFHGTSYFIKTLDSSILFKKHFPSMRYYGLLGLMTKFKSSSYDETSEDLLQHCFNLKHLIESASQFKEISTEEFLHECTPFPFSLVKSPYIEKKAIFDLETNGLPQFIGWNNVEILQIALVDAESGNKYWNQYINPTKPISNGTTEKNHLTIGSNNRLFYKGAECENAVSAAEGMKRFLDYLEYNFPEGVILIAHNGNTFDFPLLKRYLTNYKWNFSSNQIRYQIMCIDSLRAFKTHYQGLISHKQDQLIEIFRGSLCNRDAHEALGDCVNLSSAIKVAASRKNLSVSEFIGESTQKFSIYSF